MVTRDDQFRRSYDTHDLSEGERLVDSWTTTGGHLTLTSQRLLHEPMRTPEDFLATALKFAGAGEAGELVKAGVDLADRRTKWAMALTDILHAKPGPAPRSLSVTRRSGEVWVVEISDGLHSLRWSGRNVAARDRAVSMITEAVSAAGTAGLSTALHSEAVSPGQPDALIGKLSAAVGGPTRAESSPEGGASDWPPELLHLRREALNTGRPAVVERDAETTVYFSPIGQLHLSFGGYGGPPPLGGTLPGNLAGRWVATRGWLLSTWPGEPAYIDLVASGILGGRLHLFGAVPPLKVIEGSWCWVQADSELVIEGRTESVHDVIVEARVVLFVTAIEPNRISGSDGDEQFELVRSP